MNTSKHFLFSSTFLITHVFFASAMDNTDETMPLLIGTENRYAEYDQKSSVPERHDTALNDIVSHHSLEVKENEDPSDVFKQFQQELIKNEREKRTSADRADLLAKKNQQSAYERRYFKEKNSCDSLLNLLLSPGPLFSIALILGIWIGKQNPTNCPCWL